MLKLVVPSRVCCAVVLLFTPTVAYAQHQGTLDAAESFIRKEVREGGFPGGAFALVVGGRVARTGAFGVRDLETRAASTPRTAYSIASITKPLTALAVLDLEQDGRLTLDDPVTQHLPWFRLAGATPSRAVTVRDLLQHTSGLPTNAHAVVWRDEARIRPSLEAGVRALAEIEPVSAPGARFEYSNMNYAVLGVLIEKVSGRRFEQYVDDVVFAPAGMEASTVGEAQIPTERGAPYIPRWGTLGWGPLTPGRFLAPASGAWSTAEEMGQLAVALLGAGPAAHLGRRLESSATDTVPTEWGDGVSYGLGFAHMDLEDGRAAGHLGTSSHSSALWVVPGEGVGLVLLIGAYSPARTRSIAAGALSRLRGRATAEPTGPSDMDALLWVSRGMILTTVLSALLLLTLVWSVVRRMRLGWPPISSASIAKAGVLSVIAPTLLWFGLDGVRLIWSALPAPVGFGMAPLQGYPEEVAAGLAGAGIAATAWAVYAVGVTVQAYRSRRRR